MSLRVYPCGRVLWVCPCIPVDVSLWCAPIGVSLICIYGSRWACTSPSSSPPSFAPALEHVPCIIVLRQLDRLGKDREGTGDNPKPTAHFAGLLDSLGSIPVLRWVWGHPRNYGNARSILSGVWQHHCCSRAGTTP